MKRLLATIYRSPRIAEMYLYVDRAEGLKRVPAVLLQRFGTPEQVSMLLLTPERRLARVSAVDVLAQIEQVGFFLQLPPPPIERAPSGVRADHVADTPRVRTEGTGAPVRHEPGHHEAGDRKQGERKPADQETDHDAA